MTVGCVNQVPTPGATVFYLGRVRALDPSTPCRRAVLSLVAGCYLLGTAACGSDDTSESHSGPTLIVVRHRDLVDSPSALLTGELFVDEHACLRIRAAGQTYLLVLAPAVEVTGSAETGDLGLRQGSVASTGIVAVGGGEMPTPAAILQVARPDLPAQCLDPPGWLATSLEAVNS
jgi:hypothetical protein